MKKKVFVLVLLLMGAFSLAVINTGCEDDPKEACEQDLFCDDTVEVTACCTDGEDCYYTYGGVEYPDTEQGLIDLLEALNCESTKSASVENGRDYVIARLEALLEEARELSKK